MTPRFTPGNMWPSRYCDGKTCNANSASAALNKWLKPRVNEDAVMHSLRHSMRDRLRAVECPSEIIDQIGGWSSSKVGSSYGKGYELPVLAKWMKMMEGWKSLRPTQFSSD